MIVASRVGHAALGVAAAVVASMPFWAQPYHLELTSNALVLAMFALSLHLLVGGAGMVSLGHAGFFAIGAYTVHLLPPGMSILLTLPAAALLAALVALPIGALSLRTRGFFFLMVTLAFGQMLFFVFHDTPLGGSKDGVFVTPPALELFGLAIEVPRRSRPATYLWLNLGLVVAIYAALAALMGTLFGRVLTGIRDNEDRMRALGYDTVRVKLAAFVVAGGLAGIAGHAWAMTTAFVSPELAGWHRSAEALLMILLGGLGMLHGAVLGAFALVGLQEASGLITERQRLVEGLVILAVVLVLPRGLAGLAARPKRAANSAGGTHALEADAPLLRVSSKPDLVSARPIPSAATAITPPAEPAPATFSPISQLPLMVAATNPALPATSVPNITASAPDPSPPSFTPLSATE